MLIEIYRGTSKDVTECWWAETSGGRSKIADNGSGAFRGVYMARWDGDS